jgi:hypothetical protein
VVTPKPACDTSQPGSMFSVTGFLTFSVVAATSLANIMSNINNNNNKNNNNNNNDNQNDNNQMSTNQMEGKRRKRSRDGLNDRLDLCESISSEDIKNYLPWYTGKILGYILKRPGFCPEKYICNAALESYLLDGKIRKAISMFATTISAFILSDIIPNFKHETAVRIIQNATQTLDCSNIYCSIF